MSFLLSLRAVSSLGGLRVLGVGGRGGGREPGAMELRSPSPRPGEARGEGRPLQVGGACGGEGEQRAERCAGREGRPTDPEWEHSLSFPSFPEGLGHQWPHGHRGQEG